MNCGGGTVIRLLLNAQSAILTVSYIIMQRLNHEVSRLHIQIQQVLLFYLFYLYSGYSFNMKYWSS